MPAVRVSLHPLHSRPTTVSALYNLKTAGYPSGPYSLGFVAGDDPLVHDAPFLIRS